MYYSSGFRDWFSRFKPILLIILLSFFILLFSFLGVKTFLRYFIDDYSFHLGDNVSVSDDKNSDASNSYANIFKSDIIGKSIMPTVYYKGYVTASYSGNNFIKLNMHSSNELIPDDTISFPVASVPIFNALTMRMEVPEKFVSSTYNSVQDARIFFDNMESLSPQVIIVNEEDAGKKLLCLKIERVAFNFDLQELQIIGSNNNAKVTITNPKGITSALSGDMVYADSISRGDYIVFDASSPDSDLLNIDSSGLLVSDASQVYSEKGVIGEVGNYIYIDEKTYYYDYLTYTVDNAVVF